jgi:hypothetical protein
MSKSIRASALVLRLLLYFYVPLWCTAEGLSLSGQTGTLWVEDDGAAGYWQSGLSFNKEKQFYVGVDLGQIISDLPWAKITNFAVFWRGGFDTGLMGLQVSGIFFQHDFFDVEVGGIPLDNKGGKGYAFNLKAPLHIRSVTIAPSFLYGEGTWQDGSLYWFFGKPDIPAFKVFGFSAAYEHHTLELHYVSLNTDILNDDEVLLFDTHLDCFTAFYRFSLEQTNPRFKGTLGWLYAAGRAQGGLTASNQHYSLFPFVFYNINGTLSAHIGFGALDLQYKHGIFQYHVTLGAAHTFLGEIAAEIHYKQKNLFGGTEVIENISPLHLGGVAFVLLDAGIPALSIGHTSLKIRTGLQKAFAIPWGYEQFLGSADGEGPSSERSDFQASWLRTILLSGVSFYCTLSF